MPWCPACRVEYIEGIEMCSDCRVALVSELPPEKKFEYGAENLTLIVTVEEKEEAERLTAMLEQDTIPVVTKCPEGEAVELYVPALFHKKALLLLQQDDETMHISATEDGDMCENGEKAYECSDADEKNIGKYLKQGKSIGIYVGLAVLVAVATAIWLYVKYLLPVQ